VRGQRESSRELGCFVGMEWFLTYAISCSLMFRLFLVRGKLYELLTNCIPPELILKVSIEQH
jgi:hypothetical protein